MSIEPDPSPRGWFKAMRSEAALEMMRAHPPAFMLLYVIASRARWSPSGFNQHGLGVGEALIGDFEKYGMSKRQYRTAKDKLEKWGFAAFTATHLGTIARLVDSSIFEILGNGSDTQAAHVRHTGGTQPAPKEEGERIVQGKEDSTPLLSLDTSSRGADPIIETIYQAYPKKAAKAEALKAIAKALKKIPGETLLAATQSYAKAMEGADLQYVRYPATWFNGECYNDNPETWKINGANYGKNRINTVNPRNQNSNAGRHTDYSSVGKID